MEEFTPLVRKIFLREGLEFTCLENLTPGTNAAFRTGNYVVKIFAPRESGMEPHNGCPARNDNSEKPGAVLVDFLGKPGL